MKPQPLFLGMISLIAIASTARSIFNEATPAVIENSRKRLIEIDNTIKPLLEKGLKDGAPDAAIVAQIEALESEAKQLGVLQNAAERSFAMNAIPESERFQSEFKLSKSEERDLSKFSILEACNVANNDGRVEGLLADLRIEAQKELHSSGVMAQLSNVAIPRIAMEFAKHKARFRNATQSVTGSNLGSQFVATDVLGGLTQMSSLLASPIMEQAGAFILRGLMGNILIPVIAPSTVSGGTVMKAENASANAADHATTSISLAPKRLPVYVDISDQLVMQSSPDVEALILSLLLERLAVTKDTYAINGTGSSTVPYGILTNGSIGSVTTAGANGSAPTFAHMVNLETTVANANSSGSVYLTNSKVRGALKQTQLVASSSTAFVWGNDNLVNGYRTLTSNVVPSDLVKAASGTTLSACIFGDFSKYLMAYWGGLMIEKPRDKTGAITGTGTIVVTEFFDGACLQPAAFAAVQSLVA